MLLEVTFLGLLFCFSLVMLNGLAREYYLRLYIWVLDTRDDIFEAIKRWREVRHQFKRCIHHDKDDIGFQQVIVEYTNAVNDMNGAENNRIILGNCENPIDLGTTLITIDIPMTFHLIDHDINQSESYWKDHIINKIIVQLNTDYNRNQTKYRDEYLAEVNKLFASADISKRNHYLNLINVFPNNINVEWKFHLKKIIIKPTKNITVNSKDNEHIFSLLTLEDPEFNLNIVIASGSNILGVSVFPFSDRNPTNNTTIDPKYKHRNAVIINTSVFKGNTPPFNKFRTFTHEIGHWCGLLHPFDNQTLSSPEIIKYGLNKLNFDKTPVKSGEINQDYIGDLVADTAIQYSPTHGTVYDSFKTQRKILGGQIVTTMVRNTPYAFIFEKNNQTPNFYNFMDYTDDAQMCMFTHIQMIRMIYMMARFRPNFVRS